MKNENKIIAEFMGYKFYEHLPLKRNGWQKESEKDTAIYLAHSDLELDYHASWDWLMPVVEKIESLGYVFTIQGAKAEFGEIISNAQCFIVKDKKSSTYKAVIEFIKWYNENK